MKKTPIVFSFNDGYLMPAGVAITSLLLNANKDTFYDIFILHSSKRLSEGSKTQILKIKQKFNNCDFTFVDVKDAFEGAFEIRNITIDAYYRLLIPKLIKGYDKVIYSDVDVIFLGDVSASIDLLEDDKQIASVRMSETISPDYITKINLKKKKYCNSGYIVFNMSKIPDYTSKLEELMKTNFMYQDQDIMNIIFKEKITFLPSCYNCTYSQIKKGKNIFSNVKMFHYTGQKPWKDIVACGDIWWEYFRESVFYNDREYEYFNLEVFERINKMKLMWGICKKTGILNIMKLIGKI